MRRLVASIVLVVSLLGALPAYAAAPVATGKNDVQLWPGVQADQLIVICSITLPDSAKLPATVQFPVPAGMKVDWAGEIIGAEASQDVQRQPQLKNGTGGQYAEFEISKARQAQVELSGGSLVANGANLVASLEWIQTASPGVVAFSIRLPAGASAVQMTPQPSGAPQKNTAGETLYTLPSADLKAGGKQTIAITYTMQSVASKTPAAAGGGISGNTLIALLAVALVVAALALWWALRRQKTGVLPAQSDAASRSSESRPARGTRTRADEDEAFRFDD